MREQKFFCSIILTQQPSEFPVLCFNTHHLKKKEQFRGCMCYFKQVRKSLTVRYLNMYSALKNHHFAFTDQGYYFCSSAKLRSFYARASH